MDARELMKGVRDALSVRQVFGEPVERDGVTVIPVWNKSNREHGIVGSEPASVRAAADQAVRLASWKQPYHVDADHINLGTVDRFIEASDFYTLDVAASIGQPAEADRVDAFLERHPELVGEVKKLLRRADRQDTDFLAEAGPFNVKTGWTGELQDPLIGHRVGP